MWKNHPADPPTSDNWPPPPPLPYRLPLLRPVRMNNTTRSSLPLVRPSHEHWTKKKTILLPKFVSDPVGHTTDDFSPVERKTFGYRNAIQCPNRDFWSINYSWMSFVSFLKFYNFLSLFSRLSWEKNFKKGINLKRDQIRPRFSDFLTKVFCSISPRPFSKLHASRRLANKNKGFVRNSFSSSITRTRKGRRCVARKWSQHTLCCLAQIKAETAILFNSSRTLAGQTCHCCFFCFSFWHEFIFLGNDVGGKMKREQIDKNEFSISVW